MAKSKQSDWKIDIEVVFQRHPFAQTLLEELTDAGHDAVLVGGVIRDGLRDQLEPEFSFDPKEVDIATSALPAEMKEIFKGHKMMKVGEAFGVLVIMSPEQRPYEVATFRIEGGYDGRRPSRVEHVRELKEDLIRRDFTVNGLAARADGVVLDYVGGIPDLEKRVIRAIGDPAERFQEDYLRLLRAVRFASLLDAELSPETWDAIQENSEGLRQISAERIRDEFLGILSTSKSAKGIRLLDELNLLEIILPELVACKGVPQPEKYHPEGDVFIHTLMALEIGDQFILNPRVKLALLLHDIGKPMALEINQGAHAGGHDQIGADMAAEICRRLRMSNTEVRFVESLVREHQRVGQLNLMTRSHQMKFIMQREDKEHSVREVATRFPWLSELVQLMIADSEASAMKSKAWLPVVQTIQSMLVHLDELDETTRAHKLIDGNDLLQLGAQKGPQIGKLLDQIYEQIFAGDIKTRDEALKLASELISQKRSKS